MAKKKSAAQLRRLKKRALERGEEYIEPETVQEEESSKEELSKIAKGLVDELAKIKDSTSINARDRRTEKRKAEAIALKESGCVSIEELMKHLPEEKNDSSLELQNNVQPKSKRRKVMNENTKNDSDPCILFVGQLSYETTKEQIFEHFQRKIKKEDSSVILTPENFQIRLLTDSKKKKSRGMAFIQMEDPKVMHLCLHLHHTVLDSRRINVEKTAGGKKEKRKEKISKFRQEQADNISDTLDNLFKEFVTKGDLDEDEFDENVHKLCRKLSPSIVHEALKKYITEKTTSYYRHEGSREFKNKSAYFTALLIKTSNNTSKK